ncbi:DUF1772 domain-containing protein [Vibrio cholerae]|nr:DUF1772 domain-containing protein [Vibrio cholerae]
MILLAQLAVILALLCVAVVYGTDVFCALVQRPALARVDDVALTAVMGNVHHYGDRRMPVPGAVGLVASAAAAVLAAIAGGTGAAITAGSATLLLISWTVVYARISAPINRTLTAASDDHRTPEDARSLQNSWDRVIVVRAALQGLAVLALGITLILT